MEDELFTVVNWKLKLLDDETPPVWHAGEAKRYAEHTNMIHVSIASVGEGEEELCFEYMRLESCDATKNSASSLALFERLLQKQRAWIEADSAREVREQRLRDAAMDGDVDQVRDLIDADAPGGASGVAPEHRIDIDAQDDLHRTALILASAFGRLEVVKLLLRRGAQNLVDNYGHSAASWAKTQGHAKVRALLEQHDFEAAAANAAAVSANAAAGGSAGGSAGGGDAAAEAGGAQDDGMDAVSSEGSGGVMPKPAARSVSAAPPAPPGGAAKKATPRISLNGPLTAREVMDRIVCSVASRSVKLSRTSFRYAFLSQRGFYPESPTKANQDACFVNVGFNGDKDGAFFGVFDGHGAQGDLCAQYARDHVQSRFAARLRGGETAFGTESAYRQCFNEANAMLHATPTIDDSLSGTTAVTVYIRDGGTLEVANVGDSRVIIVSVDPSSPDRKKLVARPLSIDQTPFRKDERERCKRAGARVMTMDQLDGLEPIHENWGLNLGEEIDDIGDPPRIWHPQGQFPGCAFTRSIGDMVSEELGVFADPELETHTLTPDDRYVIIASDGVWEFLTSQAVADLVAKFDDPLEACRAVVTEAYELWLQYEERTDDITMIALFLDEVLPYVNPEDQLRANANAVMASAPGSRKGSRKISLAELTSTPMANIVAHATLAQIAQMLPPLGAHAEPGRRQRKARRALTTGKLAELADGDETEEQDFSEQLVPHTEEERARIDASVKANFLFQHLSQKQRDDVYAVMQAMETSANQVVITQGEEGEQFYVVDSGRYEVRVRPAADVARDGTLDPAVAASDPDLMGPVVHAYGAGGHFGELALMYSKPRAASIVCVEPGRLWALNRSAFRTRLMKSSRKSILRTLRGVDVLRSLDTLQLQRLEETLTEHTFNDGDRVIQQGELGDSFYIIREGAVRCTITDAAAGEKEVMRLGTNQYFGERAILYDEPRAASVWADGKVTVLSISRRSFEEVLGPLEAIIDADRRRRERAALETDTESAGSGSAAAALAEAEGKREEQLLLPTSSVRAFLACASGSEFRADAGLWLGEIEQESISTSIRPPEGHCQYSVIRVAQDLASASSAALASLGSATDGADRRLGLKTIGAAKAEEEQQQGVLANERWLWGALPIDDADDDEARCIVPRLLATCVDRSANCAHVLISRPIVAEFTDVLDTIFAPTPDNATVTEVLEQCRVRENAARFYIGCATLGLSYLHGAKVLYRAMAPELLLLSESGYLQLADFRMAKRLGGAGARANTLVGVPQFMAPEQVRGAMGSGTGHGFATDYWGLGVLMYELLVGSPPFGKSTGVSSNGEAVDELSIYEDITSHKEGTLELPPTLSDDARSLLDALLSPDEERRLQAVRGTGAGAAAAGAAGDNLALRAHPWFAGLDWDALAAGELPAPWIPGQSGPKATCRAPAAPSDDRGIFYGAPPPAVGPALGYLEVDNSLRAPCVVDSEARWLDSF